LGGDGKGAVWAVAAKLASLDAGAVASLGWQAECGQERPFANICTQTFRR